MLYNTSQRSPIHQHTHTLLALPSGANFGSLSHPVLDMKTPIHYHRPLTFQSMDNHSASSHLNLLLTTDYYIRIYSCILIIVHDDEMFPVLFTPYINRRTCWTLWLRWTTQWRGTPWICCRIANTIPSSSCWGPRWSAPYKMNTGLRCTTTHWCLWTGR